MEKPHDKSKSPIEVELKAGQTYYWCACGKTATEPFCDGSHECTDFAPLAFTAEKTKQLKYAIHLTFVLAKKQKHHRTAIKHIKNSSLNM